MHRNCLCLLRERLEVTCMRLWIHLKTDQWWNSMFERCQRLFVICRISGSFVVALYSIQCNALWACLACISKHNKTLSLFSSFQPLYFFHFFRFVTFFFQLTLVFIFSLSTFAGMLRLKTETSLSLKWVFFLLLNENQKAWQGGLAKKLGNWNWETAKRL